MPTPLELRNANLERRMAILESLFADSDLEDFTEDPQAIGADAKTLIQMFGTSIVSQNVFDIITTSAATFSGFTCKTTTGYVQVTNWNGATATIFGSGDPNATLTPTFLAAASPYTTAMPKRIRVSAVTSGGGAAAFTEIALSNSTVVACYGDLPSLTSLSISSAPLAAFGGVYPALETLTLASTNIERLPKYLPSLRTLTVSGGSRIKYFRNTYPLLETLALTSSKLAKFSGDFPYTESIALTVTGNGINTFTGDFPALNSLVFASGINSVKDFSGNFPLLTSLTAVGSGAVKMESFSGSFPELQTLELGSNELTSFSGNYPKLITLGLGLNPNLATYSAITPLLETLNIGGTSIATFAMDLPELDTLFVANGALTSFTGSMPKLRMLDLSGCHLTGVFSGTCPLLRSCNLNNNEFTGIAGTYPDLISLRLSNNLVETFDMETITPAKVLGNPTEGLYWQGELHLDGNPLTSVRADGFSGFGITTSAFKLENCNLSEVAINTFLTGLAAGVDFFGTKPGIRVQGNPGAATCDTTIATAKNYTVVTA